MNIIERMIAFVCHIFLWVSTSVIFVILTFNTLLRYINGASLQWANEVPELLFPWLVMSGVVLAALHGTHITTSFLVDKLAGPARRFLGVVGWLVVAALYATLSVSTWRMLEIVHDEKSPILQIPGSVTYACVMTGMVLLSILALIAAWRAFASPNDMPASSEPAPVHW